MHWQLQQVGHGKKKNTTKTCHESLQDKYIPPLDFLHSLSSVISLYKSVFFKHNPIHPHISVLDWFSLFFLSLVVNLTMVFYKHQHSLRFGLPLLLLLISYSSIFTIHALNIGVQTANSAITVSKDCSRNCESAYCAVPPLLRYGKYCGLLYSGCPGEKPCDGLDACCMKHDACVQAKNNDYLSQECSQNFLNCMANFQKAGAHTFKGNTCSVNEVIDVISAVIEAALLAGRVLHKP